MRNYLLLLLFPFVSHIETANILAVFPFPGKSHFVMFGKILRSLAEKGHEVDVLSHFPLTKPLKGYNDLSLVGTQQIFTNNLTMDIVNANRIATLYFMILLGGRVPCESTFKSDVAKNLRNSTKKYDLVITETFTSDCMLGWGYHFGVPVVTMTSSVALPWANHRLGNPDNPSYIPSYEVQFKPRMTLYERVINTLYLISAKIFFYSLSDIPSNRFAKEFFGEDMPHIRDLVYNVSLYLVNSHFSINQARPTVPNFIEVGGMHIEKPKPLNKHFQDILKTTSKGIIYLTMGSMILTESFPVNKIQAMFDAFAVLPYKVVWKATKGNFPTGVKFPENIHFETWMPQLDILCDPNVKLFVTHGGLMGTQEAIYCGVPCLGIPLFSDQLLNIKQSERMGLAIEVAYDNITKESILEATRELLENPKYDENAKEISRLFRDRPISPLDTAIYWIEYVIRYNGAPHLRSIGSELIWYQYYLLDVGLILISIPLIFVYLLLNIRKFIIMKKLKNKQD